jgi:WD40 repeat protein
VSEPATPARPFYVTGGTLKPGEPSYVERRADTDLFDSILAGEFCYVLTARQMGKSSLMARTATRLEQGGVASAIVDLTQIGSERGAQGAAQWYFGIANKIHQQLKIDAPLRSWWQERADLSSVQRLTDFFRELVLTQYSGRVVIFVDEIDSTIGLPFADDFFAALRACFNARATEPEFERLTFVLLGVATPDQLIQDPARTPFNIGRRIDLTDFSPDEARTLAPGLHVNPGEADKRLERIFYWTGGHPYLSQALCRAVRERAADTVTAEKVVDSQVEELFLSSRAQREEANLKHAKARLEKPGSEGRRLLQLYRRVRRGKPVPDQPASPLFAQLKLAGVVKATDEGRLAVRNHVYEAVFTPEWAKSAMPSDRGRQLAAATLAATLAGVLVWYAAFQPRPYEQAFRTAIKDDGYNTAREAYKSLRANPFSRARASELMLQFWEQRALRYALNDNQEASLLSWLQGLGFKDSEKFRRQAQNLVSQGYEKLKVTIRYEGYMGEQVDDLSFETPTSLAFSPDGRTLMSGSTDGTVHFLDVASGKFRRSFWRPADHIVKMAFSPDGRAIATRLADGTVRLWNLITGEPLASSLRLANSSDAHAYSDPMILSPGGRTLATSPANRGIVASSILSGIFLTLLQGQHTVDTMTFSPNGRILAVAGGDILYLLDAITGKALTPPLRTQYHVYSMAFSADSRILATGSMDGTVHLFDAVTLKPFTFTLQCQDRVAAIAFSPNGRLLATEGNHAIRLWLWDAAAGNPSSPLLPQEQVSLLGLAISPDGRAVAAGFSDGTAHLLDASTGKLLAPPLQQKANGSLERRGISSIGFSPNGRILATGSEHGRIGLWNAITGEPLAFHSEPGEELLGLPFSPAGGALATVSFDRLVLFRSLVTGELLGSYFDQPSTVATLAFSPDGRTLATGGVDAVYLWDVVTGKPFAPLLKIGGLLYAVAFSPDGRVLATGTQYAVRLWDWASGRPLTNPPPRLQGSPDSLAFSPDGKAFFTATEHWLNTYSWDGKKAVPLSRQFLHGFWEKAFRFPSDCERCIQVALGDAGNSFHLETLRLDQAVDPPIKGNPKKLLEKWRGRLGMKFDDQMRPVPVVDLPGAPAEASGGGARSPGARPR